VYATEGLDQRRNFGHVVLAVGCRDEASTRSDYTSKFSQGTCAIRHVIKHVARDQRVEACSCERQVLGIDYFEETPGARNIFPSLGHHTG
jgi:hypothetical protein